LHDIGSDNTGDWAIGALLG